MIDIYFSHLGNPLLRGIQSVSCESGSILDILNELNSKVSGLIGCIINDNNKILSSARIFKNVDVQSPSLTGSPLLYETDNTVEVKDVDDCVEEGENILISLFEPKYLEALFKEALAPTTNEFEFKDLKDKKVKKNFRPIIEGEDFRFTQEPIYSFKDGETTLESLKISQDENFNLKSSLLGFDKQNSKILPFEMVEAIKEIWDISSNDAKLRLFQEDALFFILAKLLKADYPSEKTLLLSMPTGGGKTEAFMVPILSHIFKQKEMEYKRGKIEKRIRSIVIYPTNALANDQAKRFVELIYLLNKTLRNFKEERKITIGILTGDTPQNSGGLPSESLIQICPKCRNSEFAKEEVFINGGKKITLKCKSEFEGRPCNHLLTYCRMTKNDVLENPPDILITNPDTINFSLHSPKYARIFYNKVDSIVFDEVHMYEGVFGCHISHLLRRLEEIMGYKPLYIGLSATVGNAKELASLLFNEQLSEVRYIHNKEGAYTTKKVQKMRYHALVKPRLISESSDGKHYERTITTAFVMGQVLGHLVADPHFRKAIIFANYKSDADDIAKFLKEREELDFKLFIKTVVQKWEQNKPLDPEEAEIGLWIFNWYSIMRNNATPNNELIEVGWNRGGLEKEVRIRSVHTFSENKIIKEKDIDSEGNVIQEREERPIDVMVATKTLELGIDIGDVTTVINSSAPYTTNEYVQRVGRAGRRKDSFALTIVNPENAIDSYFDRHFNEYIKNQKFEDVPIIVANEIIAYRHIVARILDYVTKILCNDPQMTSVDLKIRDLVEALVFNDNNGNIIKFKKNCGNQIAQKIAKCLYDEIFEKRFVEGEKAIALYISFIKNESRVLGIEESQIDEEFVQSVLNEKLVEIAAHLNEGNNYWQEHEFISGFNSKDKSLTPSLRGSGENVGLYLNTDESTPKEVISRNMAFNLMPPGGATATSGISSFLVYDVKGENDVQAQRKIRREIRRIGDKAINFFVNKFPSFPKDSEDVADNLSITVPRDLRVKYYPQRFYCNHCEKGLALEEVRQTKFGLLCKCGTQVSQLSQVYLCADKDGCGELHEPPVAKICFNPECIAYKSFFKEYEEAGYRVNEKILEVFKFRLTRNLEWVCRACETKLNFHQAYRLAQDNPAKGAFKAKVASEWKNNNRKDFYGLAVHLKRNPEYHWDDKHLKSSYNCKSCRENDIKPVTVPRVRTISFSYLHKDENRSLCNSIDTCIGKIDFTMGKSIQLANEYYRRYSVGSSKNKETKIKFRKIFNQDTYLGNYFETHIAWLKLNDKVDKFINEGVTCGGNCSECSKINDLELGHLIVPRAKIEKYNWVKDRPKKPDPREKYCQLALKGKCEQQTCEGCDEFKNNKNEFLKFILIHTLKHGILWALPKYAGVGVSGIRGEIYPNDKTAGADIALIDTDDGGSGAILLIQKNWDYIWEFTKEVIFMAEENKANLLLPHTCSRYNRDLCPFIAAEFLRSLQ